MKKLSPLVLLLFASCTTIPEPPRVLLQEADPPEWVLNGNGAFQSDEKPNIFYGVGSASGFSDYSLQRVASDNRARNDLAKVVDFFTASLYKDYRGSDGNLTEEAIKMMTHGNFNGVVIVEHWEHPKRNELFSLAKLDLDRVKKGLNTYLKLSEKVQMDVERRAKDLHQEMEDKLREYRKNNNWVSQLWMEARPTF